MSINFCGSISIFGHVYAELHSLQQEVVGQCALKCLNLSSKLENIGNFPWKVHG